MVDKQMIDKEIMSALVDSMKIENPIQTLKMILAKPLKIRLKFEDTPLILWLTVKDQAIIGKLVIDDSARKE